MDEIVNEGKINLIKKLLTIGAHWSPLELEKSHGINILTSKYLFIIQIILILFLPYHWSPLEFVELDDIVAELEDDFIPEYDSDDE